MKKEKKEKKRKKKKRKGKSKEEENKFLSFHNDTTHQKVVPNYLESHEVFDVYPTEQMNKFETSKREKAHHEFDQECLIKNLK